MFVANVTGQTVAPTFEVVVCTYLTEADRRTSPRPPSSPGGL